LALVSLSIAKDTTGEQFNLNDFESLKSCSDGGGSAAAWLVFMEERRRSRCPSFRFGFPPNCSFGFVSWARSGWPRRGATPAAAAAVLAGRRAAASPATPPRSPPLTRIRAFQPHLRFVWLQLA